MSPEDRAKKFVNATLNNETKITKIGRLAQGAMLAAAMAATSIIPTDAQALGLGGFTKVTGSLGGGIVAAQTINSFGDSTSNKTEIDSNNDIENIRKYQVNPKKTFSSYSEYLDSFMASKAEREAKESNEATNAAEAFKNKKSKITNKLSF